MVGHDVPAPARRRPPMTPMGPMPPPHGTRI
jgi:hypothetical protein